jgi:hypothetical protein
MSFLTRVENCNRRDMAHFRPFTVAGVQYGWLTDARAAALLKIKDVFEPAHGGVALHARLATPAARSRAVANCIPALLETGLFKKPRGELYAVRNQWSDKPVFTLDRGLVANFGVRAYGVHVNGVVRKPSGLHLWIGTRAKDMKVEPGKLDNMVAGGQPAGLGLLENLVKECGEEAHITPKHARTARPAGMITYAFEAPEGLRSDTLFCYDLVMPATPKLKPSEEIIHFELMPLTKALRIARTSTRFKFNVSLVIIDFAIRQGVITPENEPDFERIVTGLHERPQPLV